MTTGAQRAGEVASKVSATAAVTPARRGVGSILTRISRYPGAALRLALGPASVSGILLYGVHRCLRSSTKEIRLKGGISLISPADQPLVPLIMEIWDRHVYASQGMAIGPGSTVIDIGANLGVFAVWAATRADDVRVIAVEPSPRMCQYLEKNAARNELKNFTIVRAACGGRTGQATLYARGDESLNSLYSQDVYGSEFRPMLETPLLSLADLWHECGVERCDLLKLDCEGAEYEILLNAPADLMRNVRRIVMEYHVGLHEHEPAELAACLTAHGFEVEMTPLIDEEDGYLYATRRAGR